MSSHVSRRFERLLHRGVFRVAEAAVDSLRETRMLREKLSASYDRMHDGKYAGTPVILAFDLLIVGEQPPHPWRVVEYAFRHIGRDQRIDLSCLQHCA